MSDLMAFLSARLDEDEAAAKAATPPPWRAAGEDILSDTDDPHWAGACAANASGADAVHIARHDPVRVLREVEAKRNILARYEDCLARQEDQDYPYAPAAEQAREYEDFVLPNLAASYSGHHDYDEDWTP